MSTLRQKSIDTRHQPLPLLQPSLIVRNGTILERPTWRDALSISRIWHLRIQLTPAGETLRDLMLHGY